MRLVNVWILLLCFCSFSGFADQTNSNSNGWKISWGEPTNGISAGLVSSSEGIRNLESSQRGEFTIWIKNSNTNGGVEVVQPRPEQSFNLWLQTTNGDYVSPTGKYKSWDGKAYTFGNRLTKDAEIEIENSKQYPSSWRGFSQRYLNFAPLNWDYPINDGRFRITDCFKVKKPGTYTLTLEKRYFMREKTNKFVLVALPKAAMQIEITDRDL